MFFLATLQDYNCRRAPSDSRIGDSSIESVTVVLHEQVQIFGEFRGRDNLVVPFEWLHDFVSDKILKPLKSCRINSA